MAKNKQHVNFTTSSSSGNYSLGSSGLFDSRKVTLLFRDAKYFRPSPPPFITQVYVTYTTFFSSSPLLFHLKLRKLSLITRNDVGIVFACCHASVPSGTRPATSFLFRLSPTLSFVFRLSYSLQLNFCNHVVVFTCNRCRLSSVCFSPKRATRPRCLWTSLGNCASFQ